MAIITRGNHAFVSWLVAATLATGSATMAETNWDALSTADWAGKPAQGVQKLAQAGGAAGHDWSTAISNSFVELGMAERRAACFSKVLTEKLSVEEQQAAAQLLDTAETADEVKLKVISGGPEMVGGFSAADATCPEGLGG